MEKYITGTGQLIYVHGKDKCEGHNCCIHNPSDHHMKDWPTHWREDRGLMERICPHGVGHPDPDDLDFKSRLLGEKTAETESIHGCDGCCNFNIFNFLNYHRNYKPKDNSIIYDESGFSAGAGVIEK